MPREEIAYPQDKPKVKVLDKKLTIMDVYILDCSGSMGVFYSSDSKLSKGYYGIIENANASFNQEHTNNRVVINTFSYVNSIETREYIAQEGRGGKQINPLDLKAQIERCHNGMTALNDAICETIEFVKQAEGYDKVIFKIFTDGEENSSKRTASFVAKLMKTYESKGWTFTFVGTPSDTQNAIRNYNIDKSNTLEYDGSAKGFQKTMELTRSAMETYSVNASLGLDVSKSFYSKEK